MERELIATGCTPIISFGLAGGLAQDLKPGSIVIADSIITPDGYAYGTDAALAARLLAALPNAVRRPIAGSETILASAAEKMALQRRTGGAGHVGRHDGAVVRVPDALAQGLAEQFLVGSVAVEQREVRRDDADGDGSLLEHLPQHADGRERWQASCP